MTCWTIFNIFLKCNYVSLDSFKQIKYYTQLTNFVNNKKEKKNIPINPL